MDPFICDLCTHFLWKFGEKEVRNSLFWGILTGSFKNNIHFGKFMLERTNFVLFSAQMLLLKQSFSLKCEISLTTPSNDIKNKRNEKLVRK